MTDQSRPEPERPSAVSFIETAGKWLALLGSIIAVGQAGSTWITGYWQARQQLDLAELKEKSEIAKQYLAIYLDKNTRLVDRPILLTALGGIDGHPLQRWATAQHEVDQKEVSRLLAAYKAQNDAAQLRDGAESEVAKLSADIDALNAEMEIERNDPERRQTLQEKIKSKSVELGRTKGKLSIATVTVEETKVVITRSEQGLPVAGGNSYASKATAITEISSKIDVDLVMKVFPEKARKNVEIAVPYLRSAFQEFKISDKKVAASIIATVAVETSLFEPYEEPAEQAKRYENRLGNTDPGDGVKYRGRGYLGITGRANYAQMTQRLGLGTRLLDSPEDAKSPEVATRILVAWFVDRRDQLSAALARDDLAAVRRAVAGTPTQLDRFTTIYNKILAEL